MSKQVQDSVNGDAYGKKKQDKTTPATLPRLRNLTMEQLRDFWRHTVKTPPQPCPAYPSGWRLWAVARPSSVGPGRPKNYSRYFPQLAGEPLFTRYIPCDGEDPGETTSTSVTLEELEGPVLSVYTFLKLDTEETAPCEGKFGSSLSGSTATFARSSTTASPDTAATSEKDSAMEAEIKSRPPHPQANRPVSTASRVTPAIPLALTRPPKSKQSRTPEDAGGVAKVNGVAEHPAAMGGNEDLVKEPANERNTLTPDSSGSQQAEGTNEVKRTEETSGAASPAKESTERLEKLEDTDANAPISPVDTTRQEPAQKPLQEPSQEPPQQPRHEVRHELPPPFYPADHRATPTSATPSSATHSLPPTDQVSMHQPRPSANNIVFGGHPDSSSPSPAPPPSAGKMRYPPAPPPGFGGASFGPPPYYTPGHAHHFSEPHAHMMYPPMSMPPLGTLPYRRGHPPPPHYGRLESWFPADSPLPYPMAPPPGYPPHSIQPQTNGAVHPSRSPSQSSVRTQDQEPIFNQHQSEQRKFSEGQYNGQFSNQNGAPLLLPSDELRGPTDSLRQYLRSQFGSTDLADYILEITLSDPEHSVFTLPVHRLLIARSPRLLTLMSRTRTDQESRNSPLAVLRDATTDTFVTSRSLVEVLKYLYDDTLLGMREFTQGLQPFDMDSAGSDGNGRPLDRMRQALEYAASGHFLGLEEVVSRGFAIAKALIRWDTLDLAMGFALDGGLSRIWQAVMAEAAERGVVPNLKPFRPTYGDYGYQFLQDLVDFIALEFPQAFQLDTTAPQLSNVQRLPVAVESRPSISNPRLSRIRFGELPLEQPARPDFVTTTLSSILVSLPFPVLKVLLEHPGLNRRITWPNVISVMRQVVEERESRRSKALNARVAPSHKTDMDQAIYENLHWEERVESAPAHASGFKIARAWTGAEVNLANGTSGK
ncbi:hypothetical protein H2201_007179 [Coniosporium apollinis]|uniref:BTB domain-containing protein n=1 Tax=Coniosporium apollinis TaxID=61459 RepID=A0ABQ9NJU5_9PEZI|nr:hypothetical protein H2201_007179 [Coniosporium apollinis]